MSTNGNVSNLTANSCRRILCVDDEPNILEGLERTLFEHFDVRTALGGAAGLDLVAREGPFAVVVSDMRMPEMDGATFLSKVRESAPDTVRVLLTGHADVDSAIAAVNDGNIFRFLCKPCPTETLLKSLEAATRQYELVQAERELLESTLNGAITVLTELLGLAIPNAFSRSDRIKAYVSHITDRLGLQNRWKFELAAMLSQIGCIALPSQTLARLYAGQAISADESKMFADHPETAYKLLEHIPRLKEVAVIIRGQRDPSTVSSSEERIGAEMLRVAIGVEWLVASGSSLEEALIQLKNEDECDRQMLEMLRDFQGWEPPELVMAINAKDMKPGMVLDEDVMATDGTLIVHKGSNLKVALVKLINNWGSCQGIVEPIRVRTPVEK